MVDVAPADEAIVFDDVLEAAGVENQNGLEITITIRIKGVAMDGNAEAFATEHEPDDAEFPILETVDVRVRVVVKIGEWAGGDDLFSVGCGGGKAEWDVG